MKASRVLPLLALSLTAAGGAAGAGAQKIKGSSLGFEIHIPVSIAGHTYRFIVDSGSSDSCISPAAYKAVLAASPGADLKFGTQSLKVKDIEHDDLPLYKQDPGTDGLIGIDMLSKLTLGFDYQTGELFLWNHGPSIGEIGTWLAVANPKAAPVLIPLDLSEDQSQFLVETEFGKVLFDTGAQSFVIPKKSGIPRTAAVSKFSFQLETLSGPDGTSTIIVLPHFRVGSLTLVDRIVEANDAEADGIFGPSTFGVRRVLFDFAHHFLAITPPSKEDDLMSAMNFFFQNRAVLDKGRVYLRAITTDQTEDPTNRAVELLKVNGLEPSGLARQLSHDDPAVPRTLCDAVNIMKKSLDIIVNYHGKRTPVKIRTDFGPSKPRRKVPRHCCKEGGATV